MTHRQIISMWPTTKTLAEDIGEKIETVKKWRTRSSIPADRWIDVVRAANRRGISVTLEQLAQRKAVA